MEYELLDTGVFDDDRYFDVFVEYAKAAPEDVLIRITVCNRGPEAGPPPCAAHPLVPQHLVLARRRPEARSPVPRQGRSTGSSTPTTPTPSSRSRSRTSPCACEGEPVLLFTENETNTERIFGTPNAGPYVKDGFNNYVVHGKLAAVNPEQTGTKASAHYHLNVGAGADRGHSSCGFRPHRRR